MMVKMIFQNAAVGYTGRERLPLGEIPDRAAALAQCFRALKSGGVLSISEMLPDPHYQSKATLKRLAEAAGLRLQSVEGGMWLFTANFVKP